VQQLKKTGSQEFLADRNLFIMKKILFTLFCFSFICVCFGQKLSASLGKNPVAVGEPFQITFSLDASGSGFQGPDLSNFDVLSGPNGAQSMQIINGNMSQSISYSYYISAKKEGHFTLGPAYINYGGKKIESNTVTVDVGKASTGSKNQQPGTSTKSERKGDENLFVKTFVSKSSVYQGEQVLIIYKVYAHLNLVNFKDAKIPSYTGFWSQDIPTPQNYTVYKEMLNGLQYMVVEFRKTFLFPQRSGTLEIDPIEIDCIVRQQSSRQQDPWSFFGPSQEDVVYKVKGVGTRIEVKPLPESGKPAGFSGAVGQFSLKAKINKDKVKANEAINLNMSVTGKGNISLVDVPKIQTPPDIESYDPKPSENINVTAGGVEGAKSSEVVLIPRYAGSYSVAPIEFSYFDPEKKSYITLHSPEFKISVDKSDGEPATVNGMMPSNKRKDVAVIGSDIRYIKTSGIDLHEKNKHFFGTAVFCTGFILPFLSFLIFVFVQRKRQNDNSNLLQLKMRKATGVARKRLKKAQDFASANQKGPFYQEVFHALYGYLSDRLCIPVSDLSKSSVTTELQKRGVSDQTTNDLLEVIDACELARYAPSASSSDLMGLYDRSILSITKLENEIQKVKAGSRLS
jgi:hypothetical protein